MRNWFRRVRLLLCIDKSYVPMPCGCGGSDGTLTDYLSDHLPGLTRAQAQDVVLALRQRQESLTEEFLSPTAQPPTTESGNNDPRP